MTKSQVRIENIPGCVRRSRDGERMVHVRRDSTARIDAMIQLGELYRGFAEDATREIRAAIAVQTLRKTLDPVVESLRCRTTTH